MSNEILGEISWKRINRAVKKVHERLIRATAALDTAGIPYAVIGGNAVAAWVSRIDEAAVRNTRDVDILLRRQDLERAATALAAVGFERRHTAGMEMFVDGPAGKAREAIHIVFAGEKVRPEHLYAAPDVSEAERTTSFRLITLEALVKTKLTAFRDKDRMHLRDLLDVGLIDANWRGQLPDDLSERLQTLLDDPDG